MFLAFILVSLGLFLLLKLAFSKKKAEVKPRSEGEVLNNHYIIEHEKKIVDDKIYEEYVDWCRFKGEIPVEKIGFDKHRMEEFHMYKKLIKHGIGGL